MSAIGYNAIMRSTIVSLVGVVAATLAITSVVPSAVTAKPLPPSVASGLATIRRDADAIAHGRVRGASLQGPAREIAVAWATVEPALLKNGAVLVETETANTSIASFEADWKRPTKASSGASEVRSRIADLISAAQG